MTSEESKIEVKRKLQQIYDRVEEKFAHASECDCEYGEHIYASGLFSREEIKKICVMLLFDMFIFEPEPLDRRRFLFEHLATELHAENEFPEFLED